MWYPEALRWKRCTRYFAHSPWQSFTIVQPYIILISLDNESSKAYDKTIPEQQYSMINLLQDSQTRHSLQNPNKTDTMILPKSFSLETQLEVSFQQQRSLGIAQNHLRNGSRCMSC